MNKYKCDVRQSAFCPTLLNFPLSPPNIIIVIFKIRCFFFFQVKINNDSSRTYALNILRKHHIVETRQQEHITNEKKVMQDARSDFIVRYVDIICFEILHLIFSISPV